MLYGMDMNTMSNPYPVRFAVTRPDPLRNRFSVLVRVILALPILVIISLITRSFNSGQLPGEVVLGAHRVGAHELGLGDSHGPDDRGPRQVPALVVRPGAGASRFSARVGAYLLLLRHEYPSTDEHQAVQLDIAYPEVERDLNRVLPLVKWLLAIPHYLVLAVLCITALVVAFLAGLRCWRLVACPRGCSGTSKGCCAGDSG